MFMKNSLSKGQNKHGDFHIILVFYTKEKKKGKRKLNVTNKESVKT